MRRQIVIAFVYTLVTTVIFGIAYPYAVTGVAQLLFPDKANGQILRQNGVIVGSRIIGQPFTGPSYFHSRPSAAGNGYDASSSGGSNLGPTSKKLLDRIAASVAAELIVQLTNASGAFKVCRGRAPLLSVGIHSHAPSSFPCLCFRDCLR